MAPPQVTFVRDILEEKIDGEGVLLALSKMSKITPMGRHKIEFAPGVECLPIPTATLPRHPYQLFHHRQGQENPSRGSRGPK